MRRWVLVVLALVAAACLAIAVEGGRWFWDGDAIAIGPSGTLTCWGGDCAVHEIAGMEGSSVWHRAGVGTVAGGLMAAFALVVMAGALAARRSGRLAAGATMTATLTTAIAGAVFVMTRPEVPVTETVGRGLVLFAMGVVCALAGAAMVLRQR